MSGVSGNIIVKNYSFAIKDGVQQALMNSLSQGAAAAAKAVPVFGAVVQIMDMGVKFISAERAKRMNEFNDFQIQLLPFHSNEENKLVPEFRKLLNANVGSSPETNAPNVDLKLQEKLSVFFLKNKKKFVFGFLFLLVIFFIFFILKKQNVYKYS